MRNKYAFLFLIAGPASFPLSAQDNTILVYDPLTEEVDTIQPVTPTDTIAAFLPHGLGTLSGWEALDTAASPTGFLGTAQQRPPRAAATLDLTQYPVRVAGELRRVEGDSTWARCSGQLVGPWHVLTASHCLRMMGTGAWRTGEIDYYPVYDDGGMSPFGSARAIRYYVPVQAQRDCALIELEHPLGAALGWIGLGFTTEQSYFDDRIVQKFSYPADTSYMNNELIYNGDTLYHFSTPMVRISIGSTDFVGVSNWAGIPGESGSGVWITDNTEYHVLGVCTWSSAYKHTLMDAGTFQQFRTILENPALGVDAVAGIKDEALVYPNPVEARAIFEIRSGGDRMHQLSICDMGGRVVHQQDFQGSTCIFHRQGLAPGAYSYRISDPSGAFFTGKILLQ